MCFWYLEMKLIFLKVSQFQNVLLVLSFGPKYQWKIWQISAQNLVQKFVKYFVGILVQTMTPKWRFETNWPLVLFCFSNFKIKLATCHSVIDWIDKVQSLFFMHFKNIDHGALLLLLGCIFNNRKCHFNLLVFSI